MGEIVTQPYYNPGLGTRRALIASGLQVFCVTVKDVPPRHFNTGAL